MSLKSKKGWKSVMPLRLKTKSSAHFCLLPKTKSDRFAPGETPVCLNVYDLTPMNNYVYWAGFGIFHSGVEVHGVEYAFGAHDYPTSGVFEVEPRQCPGFKFRKSIFVGTTKLDPNQVREFIEHQAAAYNGDSYHLIVKNCNHFCKDICHKLTGKKIPKWVNRLAKLGSAFNCMLPEALKVAAVEDEPNGPEYDSEKRRLRSAFSCFSSISTRQQKLSAVEDEPNGPEYDGEKRRLRSAFSCFSSISTRQQKLSTSSLFLQSPVKGCLPSLELRKSTKSSSKEK
ncbi:deSI-like protein At4g17486 isoform X1 [Solanum stenotomum]|uniref:deSI-like protein At4g17486 isoform X1 n=1 Tax=Solanum stenotomum TaxID=172797 RepID=UPI0020D019E4|nr:deSI-like protein At4g17486 isoform X1 [Solanum stenotomum]